MTQNPLTPDLKLYPAPKALSALDASLFTLSLPRELLEARSCGGADQLAPPLICLPLGQLQRGVSSIEALCCVPASSADQWAPEDWVFFFFLPCSCSFGSYKRATERKNWENQGLRECCEKSLGDNTASASRGPECRAHGAVPSFQ